MITTKEQRYAAPLMDYHRFNHHEVDDVKLKNNAVSVSDGKSPK
jgi:hypothetical protein